MDRRECEMNRETPAIDAAVKERRRPNVVVVTGASAGVGRAIACEFARHGASVGLLARGRDGLAGAATDVKHLGGHALALITDVSDDRQVEQAAERIERE